MNPICFYHRADFDGVCSAAIVKKFVPDCELFGIDYGDEFPWAKVAPTFFSRVVVDDPLPIEKQLEQNGRLVFPGNSDEKRKVYVVDFSLKPDEMKCLAECCDLVWCDHHKSALESMAGYAIPGVRSVFRAACELCWEYFALGASDPPEAVRLLGRYDVWDAKNPDWARIEAFQFGARSMPGLMDPLNDVWSHWLEDDAHGKRQRCSISEVELRGRAALSYRDQEAAAQCREGAQEVVIFPPGGPFKNRWVNLQMYEGWKGLALNTAARGSWQFNSVWDPEKHDVMVAYCKLKTGKYRVSLYSTKPEVDCGAIAKSFGGGGHAGAAGFLCDELPWEAK